MAPATKFQIPTAMIQDLANTTARLLDRRSDATTALVDEVTRKLETFSGKDATLDELFQHFGAICSSLQNDKKLEPALAQLSSEFLRIGVTAEFASLASTVPGEAPPAYGIQPRPLPPLGPAIGIGLAAGTVVAIAIVAYYLLKQ